MAIHDNRPTGLTKNTGWQIGVRRTFPIPSLEAWKLITSSEGLNIWLGEGGAEVNLTVGAEYELADRTSGEVRVNEPESHIRITWQPIGWAHSSTIQIRVIPKGDKSVISFHQEHLPGAVERKVRREFFKNALNEFEVLISMGR